MNWYGATAGRAGERLRRLIEPVHEQTEARSRPVKRWN